EHALGDLCRGADAQQLDAVEAFGQLGFVERTVVGFDGATGVAEHGVRVGVDVLQQEGAGGCRVGRHRIESSDGTTTTRAPWVLPKRGPEGAVRDPGGHGARRCTSRGNSVTVRMFSAPVSWATNRSRPKANPPCGGMPYVNASM